MPGKPPAGRSEGVRQMEQRETVLCGASAYTKKFYLNEQFKGLPEGIKEDLQILCVLYTEDIGGVFRMVYDEGGTASSENGMRRGRFYV